MALSLYLNQYWFLVSDILGHLPETNFTANAQAAIGCTFKENLG